MGSDFTAVRVPVFLKPSDGIKYWQAGFITEESGWLITAELKEVIDRIYEAGYDDRLILQDFVPGDDSNLRVMICYSGRDRRSS